MVPNEVARYILVGENMNSVWTHLKPVHLVYATELASYSCSFCLLSRDANLFDYQWIIDLSQFFFPFNEVILVV